MLIVKRRNSVNLQVFWPGLLTQVQRYIKSNVGPYKFTGGTTTKAIMFIIEIRRNDRLSGAQ